MTTRVWRWLTEGKHPPCPRMCPSLRLDSAIDLLVNGADLHEHAWPHGWMAIAGVQFSHAWAAKWELLA